MWCGANYFNGSRAIAENEIVSEEKRRVVVKI